MSRTASYRGQHQKILDIVARLESCLAGDGSIRDAALVRRELSTLVGTLTVHLAVEDEAVYPRLIGHSDQDVRDLAKRFVDEMGDLRAQLSAYTQRWPTAGAIQMDPSAFTDETRALLEALRARIVAEDDQLYPLVDRTG